MADLYRVGQQETLDILLKPNVVRGSKLYDTININPDNPLLGNAPVGVRFNVKNGDYLNTVTMPNSVLQLPATEAEQLNDTYTPKSTPSSTTAQWSTQEYSLFFKFTKKTIDDLKIKYNVANGAPAEGKALINALMSPLGRSLKNDITRHAFWSKTGVDFAATYPSNTWGGGQTTDTLPLKDGFMSQIQAAVTAGDVPNYPTVGFNGNILTAAQVIAIFEEVVNNAGYILSDLFYADVSIQEKPVMLVSTSVYQAYRRYLASTGDYNAHVFRGFDSQGNILPEVKALQYEECMVIAAADVFEDWAATSAGLRNQHYVILTSRDNLQLAYNFGSGDTAMMMKEYDQMSGGYGLGVSLNPRMDYKIAELSDNGMSVAGFVAP
jgi:hypothetical protein